MAIEKKLRFDPNVPLGKENALFAVELAALAYQTKPEIEQTMSRG